MTVSFPEQFNMATYFLDDRINEGLGDKIAVYYKDQTYTYHFGRVYAAYGGVFIILSIFWGWLRIPG